MNQVKSKRVGGHEAANLAALDKHFVIDAAGKTLGRVASEAAKALMGKMRADYVPHQNSGVKVSVTNIGKLYISEKKRSGKVYATYTQFPGGLKHETLGALEARKGRKEAVRRAVKRMLPRNTMLVARMKNLTITD